MGNYKLNQLELPWFDAEERYDRFMVGDLILAKTRKTKYRVVRIIGVSQDPIFGRDNNLHLQLWDVQGCQPFLFRTDKFKDIRLTAPILQENGFSVMRSCGDNICEGTAFDGRGWHINVNIGLIGGSFTITQRTLSYTIKEQLLHNSVRELQNLLRRWGYFKEAYDFNCSKAKNWKYIWQTKTRI